ncbi:MAG: hypothetical protein ACKO72_07705 [Actinomycetes bacterium]
MDASRTTRRLLAPVDRASGALWGDDPAVPAATERDVARLLHRVTALAVLAAIVQGVAHLVNAVPLDFRFGLLNADADQGVFTWASSAATLVAAAAVATVALQVERCRALLLATAAIVAFFSLDDAVALHERITIAEIGPIEHAGRILWVTCTSPVLAFAFIGLAVLARRAPGGVGRRIMVGLWSLVAAIALEFTSPIWFALGSDHGGWLYEFEAAVEEGLELAGWLLVAGGALAAVVVTAARVAVRPDR